MTDRSEIANELLGRLAELDDLKKAFEDRELAVEAARQAADKVAEEYAGKIDEMLATGWATVAGLQAQGHVAPRRRGAGRRKVVAAEPDAGSADLNDLAPVSR
ncbi:MULTISPECIES: hypothetical protein [Mycolicibacter]|uniref:H-NS histone family protein n=2 Tax=Mycolicibacter TaxID=1073531 RepID=A0ABU5XL73_9MYCO|nr:MULTISPECIES: hypothetical protein [unclassified Mycolicibacter]MEB3022951.1 hypothetical protein [Mycolicibacter sp. MYC098]MEB3033461.1 hypothetical protein [Mycolicibacter sp. MYC340]